MSGQAPLQAQQEVTVPAVVAGTPSTDNLVSAPFAGTVIEAVVETFGAVNGAATNYCQVQVVNKGATGLGNTVVASLPFSAGTNAAHDVPTQVPLSGVAGATTVADDDVLDVQVVHIGTGMAFPGAKARLEFQRA